MKFQKNINEIPVRDRPVRFSVACNFDTKLIDNISEYPVYEVFGKLTEDFFGGGRPSFYLPEVNKSRLEKYVKYCHENGIEFNYLLNSSSMNNVEFTTKGQKELRKILDWLTQIKVDSITVSNLFFLRAIKQNYPNFKVRISAHRETDNARQVRFWEDNGADCVVISETTVHREFKVLRAMREAVSIDLSLIVNNWCRQDCAIASNHAVLLSNASRKGTQNFPLDYCSVYCNAFRLEEPVNYLRANWIRPEDLHYYEEMGYTNFKIVERNTPTDILTLRVDAYNNRRYDGNLLDIVQNYSYPATSMKSKDEKDSFSLKRMTKYFFKPFQFNMTKFPEIVKFGKNASMLYPREGDNPVYVSNRNLDGFLKRFETQGCEEMDCENCFYCHRWAEDAVFFNREWREQMTKQYDHLLSDLHGGVFWEPYYMTLKNKLVSKNKAKVVVEDRKIGGEALPKMGERKFKGKNVSPSSKLCDKDIPDGCVSIGNLGPHPKDKLAKK